MAINVLLAFMIIVAFLASIVLHEYAHAVVAYWLGDRTPQAEGRQTLSLRAHVDPVGLLMCVILAFQPIGAGPIGLGWGKPVKPDPWKLRPGANVGVLLVSLAGPLFNLIIGIVTAIVIRFSGAFLFTNNPITPHILQFLVVFACTNIALVLLNLLPIYPLDGYQILYTLLPSKQAVQFARSAPYGPFIILIIFFLVPFLATLAGLGGFPLFFPANLILQGAASVVALVLGGPFPNALQTILNLYLVLR
ncbi:MAG TPA: site-2 protease family protein [Ktedonobacteraceae bacterium]|nr:site-2 protease family protein [Ktedonobacteraceae bacterium]